MKSIDRVLTAVVAATLLAGVGTALAAGGNTGSGSESYAKAKPGVSSPSAEGPAYGTFEYEEALETGKLPEGGGSAFDPASGMKPGEDVPAIEIGARSYRVGIDTQ